VWDTETGRETSSMRTHRNGLQQVAFTSDSRLAVSVDISGGAAVWETSTGNVLFVPGNPTAPPGASDATDVTAAAWSPNGSLLLTQHDDWNNTLRVWDVAARRQAWSARGFKDGVRVAFSPDGRLFMAGVDRSTIQVWDVGQRRTIAELRVTGEIEQAVFSGDSRAIITRTDNRNTREVRQWDARAGRGFVVASFTGPADAFSADGRFALRRGSGNTVEVWEPAAGLRLAVLRGHTSSITGARFSADGRRIVTASDDGTARIYECALCGSVEELAALASRRIAISGRTLSAEERFKYSLPAPR
jgi:WD40 repeat protein